MISPPLAIKTFCQFFQQNVCGSHKTYMEWLDRLKLIPRDVSSPVVRKTTHDLIARYNLDKPVLLQVSYLDTQELADNFFDSIGVYE